VLSEFHRGEIEVRAHFQKAISPLEQVAEDYSVPQFLASRVHCELLCASCYTCRVFENSGVAQWGSVLNGL